MKLALALATVCALALATPALAVVDISSVPTRDGGKETPGQTVTITLKDEKNETIHRQTVETLKTTHARFLVPDEVAERAKTVDMTAVSRGRTDERKGIPWETFRKGGSIELSKTAERSQTRTPERGGRTGAGRTDAATTQAIVSGVSLGVSLGLSLAGHEPRTHHHDSSATLRHGAGLALGHGMATHGGMSGHGHGMASGGTETHGAMK